MTLLFSVLGCVIALAIYVGVLLFIEKQLTDHEKYGPPRR